MLSEGDIAVFVGFGIVVFVQCNPKADFVGFLVCQPHKVCVFFVLLAVFFL